MPIYKEDDFLLNSPALIKDLDTIIANINTLKNDLLINQKTHYSYVLKKLNIIEEIINNIIDLIEKERDNL